MASVRALAFGMQLSITLLSTAHALAQEAEETVPKQLALALLCSFGPAGDESPDLRVGAAPDDLPPGLVPANARILGSLVRSHGSTVVAVVPGAPGEALATYADNRTAEGWEPPPMDQRGGFISSGFSLPTSFCREDRHLSVGANRWEGGGTLLRVTVSRASRHTPCDPEMRRFAGYPGDRMPIPALAAPVGAMQRGGHAGSGRDYAEASATVETRLGASELSAHYVAQLEREGWNVEEKLVGEVLALHRLRTRDDEGREWVGVLVASAVSDAPRRYDLVFRAVDPSSPQY